MQLYNLMQLNAIIIYRPNYEMALSNSRLDCVTAENQRPMTYDL